MVRKGNPKNIQAIDDVCGVRAVAGLGTVEEAMFRGLSDKCVAGGKPPLEIVTCPPAPYSTAQRFPDTSNFESLFEMLAAIDAAYPEAFRFSPPRPSSLIVSTVNSPFGTLIEGVRFAVDSPLEEAVSSEPVSEAEIPC